MRTKVEPETEEKEIERIHCAVHGRAEKALPSYIIGFDDLLRGGFFLPTPSGSLIVLLKGGPGTGKTTMALQLAVGASRWASDSAVENRPGIDGKVKVYTKEQEAKDLRKILVDRLKTTISKDDLRGVSFNSTSKTLELGGKPWLPRYDEEYQPATDGGRRWTESTF
ncbi:MAG: hypothetical protein EHM23_23300 [Acidobacteria bacterium]|nr:MAG: hypothetical protein EHM23_23300 [Acidobacteriota bacterium]